MWLRLFHYLGLTNLSTRQIEAYYEMRQADSRPGSEISARVRRTDYLNTIIGKGSSIEGTLKVQGTLRADGLLKGNVSISDSLLVGRDGNINAEIKLRNAIVGGKVKGNMQASGKVVLENNSVFNGTLKTVKLVIDEGAVFEGNCSMTGDPGIGASTGSYCRNPFGGW